ncbi:SRPBCC domain-containing protein [Streptomyces sp. M10(2022)]
MFALVNDVERVVTCMPGAALEGRDGDAWKGGVKVKVGPITAAYAGTVRFLDVDSEKRQLRLQARGRHPRQRRCRGGGLPFRDRGPEGPDWN